MRKLLIFGAAELALDVYSGLCHDQFSIFQNGNIIDLPSDIFLSDSSDSNLGKFVESYDLPRLNILSCEYLKSEPPLFYIILCSSLRNQSDRAKIRTLMSNCGHQEISLISRHAVVNSPIPDGCLISDGVYVGPYANLAEGTIVLFNSVISRLTTLMSDTFISANVTVTARKTIGTCSFIGAGSTIDANIGSLCVIGSGSVLEKDLPDYSIYDSATSSPPRIATFSTEEKALLSRNYL